MKVSVNMDRCDSQGICAVECPEVFLINDDEELVVLQDQPPEELRPKVVSAARKCPKSAIAIED